jgi:hypothetical protein
MIYEVTDTYDNTAILLMDQSALAGLRVSGHMKALASSIDD